LCCCHGMPGSPSHAWSCRAACVREATIPLLLWLLGAEVRACACRGACCALLTAGNSAFGSQMRRQGCRLDWWQPGSRKCDNSCQLARARLKAS
jgi:hypothetical protein